jgi:peptidoglycan hydrolase-like protein with peptidoglycan-binding domain
MRFNEFKIIKEKTTQPLGNPTQDPNKVPSKETAKSLDIKIGPPFPPEFIPRVKEMQSKLEKIGYSVGSTGIDGKFGPRTSAALSAFIKDYNLNAKSDTFDNELAAQLDKVVLRAIPKAKNITPVNTSTGKATPGAGKSLSPGVKNPGAALKEPDFMKKLDQVSNRLGVDKDVLLKVMQFESKLDPQAVNPMSKATGLIQFMPNTAAALGTSVDALYNMTATAQLDYVEKYYKNAGVKSGATVGDLYILTFMPAAANKPDNFVLGNANGGRVFNLDASKVYAQNKGFDKNKDGVFTKGDVIDAINNRYA